MAEFQLSSLPFLRQEVQQQFVSAFWERSCDAGEELFQKGEEISGVAIILEGRVGIRKETGFDDRTQVVALLDAGAPLGERVLAGATRHLSGAVAVEACRLAVLSAASWNQLCRETPQLALDFQGWILGVTALRLGKASERLAHIL